MTKSLAFLMLLVLLVGKVEFLDEEQQQDSGA